jgi:hypothetical protein
MKIFTAIAAIAAIGMSASAFAQNATMPGGATNPPPGTTTNNPSISVLPDSTTNTARPGALDSSNVSGAQAAAQSKFQEAGYSNVKGLSHGTDGTWSGRAVKDGVEVGVVMDAGGNITTR